MPLISTCRTCGALHSDDEACPAGSPLRTYNDAELANLPEPEEDFEGRGIQAGGLEVGFGPSGCGKTTMYADRSCCLATGSAWLGAPALHSGPVLYCSLEGVSAFAKKVIAWKALHGLPAADVIGVHTMADALNLLDASSAVALLRTAENIGAREIVIDTLGRSMQAEEDNSDMGRVVGHADMIRRATGARVVLIHHSGKVRSRGARGGSALTAAADCVLSLDVKGPAHILCCEKLRDGRAFDPIVLKLVPTADGRSALFERAEGPAVSLCDATARLQSNVLDFLREHPACKATDVIEGIGRQKSAVLHALRELAKAGSVVSTKAGRANVWSLHD